MATIKEVLKNFTITVLGTTVMIHNPSLEFSYTPADDVLKPEFAGHYRYFGGLQCGYHEDTQEYRMIENALCDMAESVLKASKAIKQTMQDKIDKSEAPNEAQPPRPA